MTELESRSGITVYADLDAGVPSRMLDVFAAHGIIPAHFAFNCTANEMALHVDASGLTDKQILTFAGKFNQISGVRCVNLPRS